MVETSRPRMPVKAVALRLPRIPSRPRLGALALRFAPSWRSLLAALLLVLGACGAYVLARESSVFAVREIRVKGAPPPVAVEVRRTLLPLVGTSLLEIERSRIDRELATLPTVAAASYDREFPHTLSVYIRAERALAVLRQGAEGWLVASDGRVMRELDHPGLSSLPRIWLSRSAKIAVGSTVGHEEGAAAVAALRALPGRNLGGGVRDVVARDAGLALLLRSGIEIRLGDASSARLKLAVARRIVPSLKAPGYLDLSVPTRAVAGTIPQVSA